MSHKYNVELMLLPQDLENPAGQTGETEEEQDTAFLSDEVVSKLMADQRNNVYNYLIQYYDPSYVQELIPQFELKPRDEAGKKLDLVWKETGERVSKASVALSSGDSRIKTVGKIGHEGYRSYKESVQILKSALDENPEKFWQLIALTSGYTGAAEKTQFIISASYYKEKGYDKDGFGYVGIIYVGRQAVTDLAQRYASVLNQQIFDIFEKVQRLSEQINAYFVAGEKPQALAAAETAKEITTGAEEYAAKDIEQQAASAKE